MICGSIVCGLMACSWYRHLRVVASALLVCACVLVVARSACTQQLVGELDRQANQIYQQVFSPFCPGRSLNDCPSSKAHELKKEMRQKLEQGVPPQVVLEQVFEQYGDQYRAVPQYAGFGRLVWWAPVIFLALGLVVALVLARGKRVRGVELRANSVEPTKARPPPISPELRARIEVELERFEG